MDSNKPLVLGSNDSVFYFYFMKLGFILNQTNSSLFVHHTTTGTVYLLLYVDDMVLTSTNPALIKTLITRL